MREYPSGDPVKAPEGQFTGERELVDAAKASREHFGLLYDRYVAQVYRYAYARTDSHHDAEDVTSETFRRALEHIGGYVWQGKPFGAWLYRIAANVIIDRRRVERPREPFEQALELADGALPPEGRGSFEAYVQAVRPEYVEGLR